MMNFALKTCAQIYLASDADLQNSYSSMENIQISIENHRASIENHQFSTRINHHSLENQHTHLGCLPLPRDRSPAAQTQWPQGQFDTLPTLPQKRHQKPVGTLPTHGSKTPEESASNLPTKPFPFRTAQAVVLACGWIVGFKAIWGDLGRFPGRTMASLSANPWPSTWPGVVPRN